MVQVLVLLPPIIAIGLALITKEVYSSLFIGVVVGAILFVLSGGSTVVGEGEAAVVQGFFQTGAGHTSFEWNFDIMGMVETSLGKIIDGVADPYNAGILLFLVLLGMLVALVTKAGGSRAYGEWASSKIKSKRAALLATSALGVIIFIDDYFNCLTVGTVMRPITDKHKVSRAKLSYIIDATAAPVCIIAPVSSWGAAITSSMSVNDAFTVFLQTIPFNFYALLTIIFLVVMALMRVDFGPMKEAEDLAEQTGELGDIQAKSAEAPIEAGAKGTVWDLIVPIIVLIICSVLGMVYTGGGFSGVDFLTAFTNCDAPTSLNYGALAALLCTAIMYLPRKIIGPRDFMDSLVQGFKSMVPAICILALAWALGGICRNELNLGGNIAVLLEGSSFLMFMPVVLFILGSFIGFATGTSWGTMAILIPLSEGIFGLQDGGEATTLLIICIAAAAAGAVLGDHASPISDTTIMASTGAQCDHLQHVSTQLPYVMLIGSICIVTFLVAGLTASLGYGLSLAISWLVAALGLCGAVFGIKVYERKKKAAAQLSDTAEKK